VSTPRPYNSRLRAEQAEETRLKIRRAARLMFERQGFADTTVAAIAEEAGVAVPTVYANYRSKGGVVGAMLEELEEAADQPGWEARIRAETDPVRQLHLFVSWIRILFESGAPILRAAMEARGDADVAAMIEHGDDSRLGGTTTLAEHWDRRGVLRPGLEALEAAHSLWLLTSFEQYQLATDRFGWSSRKYERWLSSVAEEVILGPGPGAAS